MGNATPSLLEHLFLKVEASNRFRKQSSSVKKLLTKKKKKKKKLLMMSSSRMGVKYVGTPVSYKRTIIKNMF